MTYPFPSKDLPLEPAIFRMFCAGCEKSSVNAPTTKPRPGAGKSLCDACFGSKLEAADDTVTVYETSLGMVATPKTVKAHEVVDHPSHYTYGKLEVWDAIIALELNYCRGNVLKYIARAGKKNVENELEDLRKAQAYLAKEIARVESERNR